MASRSSPSARTVPLIGRTNPLSTLKNVVLPAPFGPINPHVPESKVTVMPSSGVTPPKRTVRPAISIISPPPRRKVRRRSSRDQLSSQARQVLGYLRGQAAGRRQQHLQHAGAEQDDEQIWGQSPIVEQR